MHYIDLHTNKVFIDKGNYRLFLGIFYNAKSLQELLRKIADFTGYKKPKSYIAVIRKFEKETKEDCIY